MHVEHMTTAEREHLNLDKIRIAVFRDALGEEKVKFFPGDVSPPIHDIYKDTLLFVGHTMKTSWPRFFEVRFDQNVQNADVAATARMRAEVWEALNDILSVRRLPKHVPEVYPTARELGLRLY